MVSAKSLLLVFIVGTSLFSSIITQLYIAIPNSKKKIIKNIDFLGIGIPFIIGIAVVAAFILYKTIRIMKYFAFLLVGAVLGLLMSTYGSSLGLPTKLFNFTEKTAHLVHPIAMFLYAGIFELVIKNIILFLL